MKQKLGLACSLVRAPKLLLLDEPSVGVDPVSRRELWKMVYALVDRGIGIIWSTAYLDEAERCQEVLLLDKGKLLYRGKPADLTKQVEGRTFAIRNIATDPRQLLALALKREEVIDGVIQGQSVRLVLKPNSKAPTSDELGASAAEVAPVPPRFEDAFISLLGGIPKSQVESATGSPEAGGDNANRQKNGKPAVEAMGLTRRFGDFTAVDGLSPSLAATNSIASRSSSYLSPDTTKSNHYFQQPPITCSAL